MTKFELKEKMKRLEELIKKYEQKGTPLPKSKRALTALQRIVATLEKRGML